MYFCPNCSYVLDIAKASGTSKSFKKIKNVTEALKILKDGDNIKDYKADFNRKTMYKNKKYIKMSDEDKTKLETLFATDAMNSSQVCNNCGYENNITESIRLYEFNTDDTEILTRTLEDNKLICSDPTLPRTRDYTCKNNNCITHKKPELKEAVFSKIPKKYSVEYICCVCNYSWY